jgi:hypothetical protein
MHVARHRVGQHAEGPCVCLAEVTEAEQPESRREVEQRRSNHLFGAPAEVRGPEGDAEIATARHDGTDLLLESFGDAQRGGQDGVRQSSDQKTGVRNLPAVLSVETCILSKGLNFGLARTGRQLFGGGSRRYRVLSVE